MGNSSFLGLTIYRNIYVEGYEKFPYQSLKGKNTLMYKGKIICFKGSIPNSYNPKEDYLLTCSCDFDKYKNLKRIV